MKPSFKAIKAALAKHADFSVEITPCQIQIEGNASAIGPVEDAETNDWIRTELDSGNEHAWCDVVVTATWRGFEGVASMGCCSYPDRASIDRDLIPDMKHEASIALAHAVHTAHENISKLIGGKS